ncbi:kelch-like protein 10 [Astatotilapia calliptera]|uniref:BTB domain-containing protein n=1 Tax=Astatotilapia calliptera TaxID=8154 RepID=A0A3P8QAV9_ASTCA|nr:kelch-like protein 10 [Astatotilapia calliptera]
MREEQPPYKSSSVYNELRFEGKFCDAIIKVEDVEFPVHKIILCNCTPSFRALFTSWSDPDKQVFNIPGLSPEMMALIIDFAYTGSVSVTEENAVELLMAADQLNVMDIVKICSDFVGEQLCAENCVGIWQFTKVHLSPELRAKAFHYIVSNFEQVVLQEEFLQLTVEELGDILERDDLNVQCESTAYEALIKWISHVPAEREQHLIALLSKVRLGLVTLDYLRDNVRLNQLVRTSSDRLSMIKAAIILPQNMTNRPYVFCLCPHLARPRLPHSVLLAIGGWSDRNPTNAIEAYDYRAECWVNVTNNLEHPRAYHGAAFLNGYVYSIGGFDRVEHFNSVCRFDLTTRTWNEVAPMYCRRCYVSVTVLNGFIYAMGGYDGHVRLSSAERYQPETNQWSLIASMHEQRSDASCTTLHSRIYICGGFNGNECLQTAECYNPETDQWTMISPMNSRRSGIGVIAYADHVFAVGGFDGNRRLRTAEAYNPQTNTWNLVSSMLTRRSNFGIEVINNRLFAVGGFNGFTTTFNVEYYDASTNRWFNAPHMGIFRSALSCCVVSGHPNLSDYTIPRDSLTCLNVPEEAAEST